MYRTWYGKNNKHMMDKETWKIRTDPDKMAKSIKYHMHVQNHKRCLLEKTCLSNHKTIHCLNDSFKNTPSPNREIQMDQENDV